MLKKTFIKPLIGGILMCFMLPSSFAAPLPPCDTQESVNLSDDQMANMIKEVEGHIGNGWVLGNASLLPGYADESLTVEECRTLQSKWGSVLGLNNKGSAWSLGIHTYLSSHYPRKMFAFQNLGIVGSICATKIKATCFGGKSDEPEPSQPIAATSVVFTSAFPTDNIDLQFYKGGLNAEKTACEKSESALIPTHLTENQEWEFDNLDPNLKYCYEISAPEKGTDIAEFNLVGTSKIHLNFKLRPLFEVKFHLLDGDEEDFHIKHLPHFESMPTEVQANNTITLKGNLYYQLFGGEEYEIQLKGKKFILYGEGFDFVSGVRLDDRGGVVQHIKKNPDDHIFHVHFEGEQNNDELSQKTEKVKKLKVQVDGKEIADIIPYFDHIAFTWNNAELGGVEPQTCTLLGEDGKSYDRHGKTDSEFSEHFAGCGGLFMGSTHANAFPKQSYTLTIDFGDNIKKAYTFKFNKLADVERKTDYDPTQSTNEMVKKHYVARSGTPLVDVKEGMEFQAGNPAKYQHLMFLYKVNNLQGAEKTRYEIRLNDNQGDVIAYGHREQVKALDGFVWSFRDWRADPQFKVEDIDQYRGGPAGLTVVEARNDDILKAGTKVVFIVKLKYADREETIEYPYTLTQEDVISASIGDKVILTFKDGDQELSKQVLLSGTAAIMPANPSKSGYTFLGWTTDKEGKQKFDVTTKLGADTILYAQWKKNASSGGSGGSSSGGGGGSSSGGGGGSSYVATKTSTPSQTNTQTVTPAETSKATNAKSLEALTKEFVEINKADVSKVENLAQALASVQQSALAQELKDAYTYAYLRGMTTMPTIEKADLHRGLTRAEMAKMMAVYATQVMGKKAQKTDTPKYADVDANLGDLADYIALAYQLGIMGVDGQGNSLENFAPQREVTRAEFATVLSRVLFGDTYNAVGANWAEAHLHALKTAGIIKDTTASMKELRGWVMLMLMRSEGVK